MEFRRYHVHTRMRAVDASNARKEFVSIPIGAILVIGRDRHDRAMYVNVEWNKQELLVFPQGLSERAVEFDGQPNNPV